MTMGWVAGEDVDRLSPPMPKIMAIKAGSGTMTVTHFASSSFAFSSYSFAERLLVNMGTTNSATKLLLSTMLLLLLVATQCHGFSWFNLNLLSTPCNQCSMDTIKLTEGDYAKDKSSTPTSTGLQSDDNGCNTLTVTCPERMGEQTFMTLNDKKNLAGSLRKLPLVCNAKGEWEFQFPGRADTYAVTEVSCTHDSMKLPPFWI